MSEYYDKSKFTGEGQRRQPPPPPPPRKSENANWYTWPLIIILFSLGAWPIALILLYFTLFGSDKKSGKSKSVSFEQAGRDIENKVESAVEQAIRRAGERANRAAEQADRAADRAADRSDEALRRTDEALRRAAEQVERTIGRTARQVERAGKRPESAAEPPREAGRAAAKQAASSSAAARPVKEKKQKKGKIPGKALRVLGIIIMAISAPMLLDVLADFSRGWWFDFDELYMGLGFLAGGGLMFGRGQYLAHMTRRSQRYILAIGNTDAMPLSEIAKRVNRSPAKAARELQKLIDKGYLGEDAYIDHERGYFLRFGATLEEDEPEEETADPFAPEPEETADDYDQVLRNIRRANDRIADPELSRKIDRLEQVTGLIFREVEEHPEKRERIRTFFDYYLPTTQKLLDAYAEFEETGVEGENLRQAKERIEQTMDAIVDGFEHQLDQLYSSDAMDVVTDIKVMEAMLNRETGSVAKDFGFPEPPKVRPKADQKDKKDGGDVQQLQL